MPHLLRRKQNNCILIDKHFKLPSGREVFLFLFFLLVSCCFWLMLTLNQKYETNVDFSVHLSNLPDNVAFSSSTEKTVTVRLRDRGTIIADYLFNSFRPIVVDFSELQKRDGYLSLPVASLRKRIESRLQNSSSLITFQPDSFLYYVKEDAIRVPVRVNGDFSTARQYIAEAAKAIPDSVLVFAPQAIADTLQYISTQYIVQNELRDSVVLSAKLMHDKKIECIPDTVQVVIPVTPYIQKSFDVPVIGVGFPNGTMLRAFPSHVKVIADIGMLYLNKITPDDFEVAVDYSDIVAGNADRVKLRLLKSPSAVSNVRIAPGEIEYLIETE